MEIHPTPFAGKNRSMKTKTTRKATESTKNGYQENPVLKQKRVFGTSRSTNIPVKTIPLNKSSPGVSNKQPKSTQLTTNTTGKSVICATKFTEKKSKSPAENQKNPNKKSVCFLGKNDDHPTNISSKEEITGPKTPVPSATLVKPKIVGTPYYSAENCSNCRFDRLETSSYWIGQIKLAESVGKLFVSASFFLLALECKAEPIRNLRVELKRYLGRHKYLSAQTVWKDVSLRYGLINDESNTGTMDLSCEKNSICGSEVN